MPAQLTRGNWEASTIYDKARREQLHCVVYKGFQDIPICLISPIHTIPQGKSNLLRDHNEEKANAYLMAQAKNLARALIALQDAHKKADEGLMQKAWEYAVQVLEVAKAPDDT